MPVVSVNPGAIKPPAGIPDNPCGVDFAKLDALDGLGKYNKDLFLKSLLGFALGMLPGPMADIINNETVVPQEFPGIGAMLGVASMLLDTKAAPPNLQGLWTSVSGNCQSGYAEATSAFDPGLQTFETALANISSAASLSPITISAVSAAYAAVRDGADPMEPRIQAGLRAACFPFLSDSAAIFDAYDAAAVLKSGVGNLRTPLTASARVHVAAPTSLSTTENLARFGVSQQLVAAGAAGRSLRLDQINGIANLPRAAANMSGPDALRTLSILRQTCTAVDDFYGVTTPGFGAIGWESMTRDLATSISSSEIVDVASEAAGFSVFNPEAIMADVAGVVDRFLARALSQGGSDNLAAQAATEFRTAVGVGFTAASAVATIYASPNGMTSTFSNTLGIMQSFGSANAINSMIGGNFSGLFGLASGQLSNPKLSLLRQWRNCLAQQHAVDPSTLQILDAKIRQEESTANVAWPITLGQFDANGYFSKTKKIAKALEKVQDAILKNKPLQIGTTV